MPNKRAGLTFSLWKYYPKCSVRASLSCSSPSEELCVCYESVCVCVISPWKVFPHSREPTSLRGGGRAERSVWWSAVTVEEEQGPLEFPTMLLVGGGSDASQLQLLSFGEMKQDTCFFKVWVMIHNVLPALEKQMCRFTQLSADPPKKWPACLRRGGKVLGGFR